MSSFIKGVIASSALDSAVQRCTGKTTGDHVCDGLSYAYEKDKQFFEESHKDALKSKTYEPWMTEDLDSGPQPCSIF